MLEVNDNLWTYPAQATVITINGQVGYANELVMGAGVALEAKLKYPELPAMLGRLVRKSKLHVYYFPTIFLFAFPTKYHWKDDSDLKLIARSAVELVYIVDQVGLSSVCLPRPGCGHGNLSWTNQVRPVLSRLLDDRFTVVHQEKLNAKL